MKNFKLLGLSILFILILTLSVSAAPNYILVNFTGSVSASNTIGPNTGGYVRGQSVNLSNYTTNFPYIVGVEVKIGTISASLGLDFIFANASNTDLPDLTQAYYNFSITSANAVANSYNGMNTSTPLHIASNKGMFGLVFSYTNTTTIQEYQKSYNGVTQWQGARSYSLKKDMGTTAGWSTEAGDIVEFRILLSNETNATGGGGGGGITNTSSLLFQGQTPANATIQYYLTNDDLTIETNASFFGGNVNTTIYLYNSTGLYATRNKNETNQTSLFNTTFSNLPVGIYRFNATATNISVSNRTETRTIFIYNITTNGINNPTDNQQITTQFLNISYNSSTITPLGTGITISSYNISLRNSDGTLNRSINQTTALFFNWDHYAQNLSVGNYRIRVQTIDSNSNSQYEEKSFNLTTNTLLNITAKTLSGTNITNFSITAYNSLYNYNVTVNTTTGVANVDQIRGLIDLNIDASGFAIDVNTSYANISVANKNYSYQFTLYQENTINMSFFNQSGYTLMTTNVTFDLIGSYRTYTNLTTNGNIILPLVFPDSYTMRYSANGFTTRFYTLTVSNRSYQNLNLYLLASSLSTNLTIYIVNELNIPIEEAYVKILKYDLPTNSYILQEIGTTDITGKVIMTVTYNDEYYKFIVEKPFGVIQKITTPSYINSNPITIQLDSSQDYTDDLNEYAGITSLLDFNNDTNNFRFTYSTANSLLTSFCVYVYRSVNQSNTLVNSSCLTGASGSSLYGVAPINGTTYKAYSYYYDGTEYQYLRGATYTFIDNSVLNIFGNYGLFLQFLLTLGLASMLYVNTSLGLLMVPFSLYLGRYIGLNSYSAGALMGVSIACIGIILYLLAGTKR